MANMDWKHWASLLLTTFGSAMLMAMMANQGAELKDGAIAGVLAGLAAVIHLFQKAPSEQA